mgnify:CR=1 FL=1
MILFSALGLETGPHSTVRRILSGRRSVSISTLHNSRGRSLPKLPGSLDDVGQLFRTFGVIGAAAGSLFVFKGKYRAVLINYPNRSEKDALFAGHAT